MTEQTDIGLSDEEKLATVRQLPEREDNLTNQQLNWLDSAGMGVPDATVEGHDDISVWEPTEGGIFLLDALDAQADRIRSEEREVREALIELREAAMPFYNFTGERPHDEFERLTVALRVAKELAALAKENTENE